MKFSCFLYLLQSSSLDTDKKHISFSYPGQLQRAAVEWSMFPSAAGRTKNLPSDGECDWLTGSDHLCASTGLGPSATSGDKQKRLESVPRTVVTLIVITHRTATCLDTFSYRHEDHPQTPRNEDLLSTPEERESGRTPAGSGRRADVIIKLYHCKSSPFVREINKHNQPRGGGGLGTGNLIEKVERRAQWSILNRTVLVVAGTPLAPPWLFDWACYSTRLDFIVKHLHPKLSLARVLSLILETEPHISHALLYHLYWRSRVILYNTL